MIYLAHLNSSYLALSATVRASIRVIASVDAPHISCIGSHLGGAQVSLTFVQALCVGVAVASSVAESRDGGKDEEDVELHVV